MKTFKFIKALILIASFVLFGFAFIFGSITLNAGDLAISTALLSFISLSLVGFFLFFAKNQIAKYVGLGLSTAAMLILAYLSISAFNNSSSAILGIVAVILYVLYFIIEFIGRLALGELQNEDPEKDPKVQKVLAWKKLKDEGVITESEYETKRQAILGLTPSKVEKK